MLDNSKKEYYQKYRLKNLEKIRARDREFKKKLRLLYPDKIKAIKKKSYIKNCEKIKEKNKLYRKNNLDKIKQYQDNYREINKEKLKLKRLEYRNKNKAIISQRQYQYKKKKLLIDKYFKLKENLRSRIYNVLKGNTIKSTNTLDLLGVTNITKVKKHLEKQFKNGMTWNNHGDWHIDHIIPCASFDLKCPVQQLACFHYKNLQPLWAYENLTKGSKIL